MAPNTSFDERHFFVVLEGFDGAGKSTTAAHLADQIKGVVYRTPSAPYLAIRDDVDRHASFVERTLFYAAAVARASSEIERLLQSSHVICDRYLGSTVAYHEPVWPMAKMLRALPVLQPDLTVVLTVGDIARDERLRARDGDAPPRWCDSADVRLGIQDILQQLPGLSIDTTALRETEVVQIIVARLRLIGGAHADLG